PSHAGGPEQALILVAEPRQLPVDEVPDARWYTVDGFLDSPRQLPATVDFSEHALRDPVLDHVDQEERVAARSLVEATHQPVGYAVPGERLGEIPADVCSRETPERKVAAESAQRQIVLHR